MNGAPHQQTFTVSEITRLIKGTLEEGFPDIVIQGEISNFRPSSTGHYYFSLKDPESIISAVMFRNRMDTLRFKPADGMLVRARGGVSVYGKRGSYQIIIESLQLAGEGDILLMLEERKRKLAAEGLFEESRKRPLPLLPSRIAVVTSPTGAAIRDVLRILKRRNAGIDVVILPSAVQGDGADEQIAHMVETANRFSLGEVIIVARGGGSLEDLLPFSSERVVRAIAASGIPVISAIGHETDYTLSDLAADIRAPTPSAAAEMVSASRVELLGAVRRFASDLQAGMSLRIERVRHMMAPFQPDNLERSFRIYIGPLAMRLDEARQGSVEGMKRLLLDARHRLELSSRGVESCSPLGILERGYAVVTDSEEKHVIVSSRQVNEDDVVRIRLAQGRLGAVVKEKHGNQEV